MSSAPFAGALWAALPARTSLLTPPKMRFPPRYVEMLRPVSGVGLRQCARAPTGQAVTRFDPFRCHEADGCRLNLIKLALFFLVKGAFTTRPRRPMEQTLERYV